MWDSRENQPFLSVRYGQTLAVMSGVYLGAPSPTPYRQLTLTPSCHVATTHYILCIPSFLL